jgi:hypothetical protein
MTYEYINTYIHMYLRIQKCIHSCNLSTLCAISTISVHKDIYIYIYIYLCTSSIYLHTYYLYVHIPRDARLSTEGMSLKSVMFSPEESWCITLALYTPVKTVSSSSDALYKI